MPSVLSFSLNDLLSATAAKTPTPGGGSVAALVGALGAALGAMSQEFTAGKKAYAAHDARARAALAHFQRAAAMLQELVEEDIAAYEALSPLLKLPADQRAAHADYLPAVVAAIRVPQTIAGFAANVLEECGAVADKTNRFLLADLGTAAACALAAVHGAELMVRVNVALLPNQEEAAATRQAMAELSAKADRTYAAVRGALIQRI